MQTDRPLANGVLLLDDGSKIPLRSGDNGMAMANVPIQKDGQYHVAAVENGEDVRLGEDYFIEAHEGQSARYQDDAAGTRFQGQPD